MNYQVQQVGVVILAAGQSSRLGSPKQLLEYRGRSLLQQAVESALSAKLYPVVVVLGAQTEKILSQWSDKQAYVIENKEWEEGMSSSLKKGLQAIREKEPDVDGVLFMACDQPFVDQHILERLLLEQRRSGLPIAASTYEGRAGIPALFHRIFFEELMKLSGDKGAKKIIADHHDNVAMVPFEMGKVDIDTLDDYKKLLGQ
jgi:molybdenum cofactor cytidylyltransferase